MKYSRSHIIKHGNCVDLTRLLMRGCQDQRQYAIQQIITMLPDMIPVMMEELEKYPEDKAYAEKLVMLR